MCILHFQWKAGQLSRQPLSLLCPFFSCQVDFCLSPLRGVGVRLDILTFARWRRPARAALNPPASTGWPEAACAQCRHLFSVPHQMHGDGFRLFGAYSGGRRTAFCSEKEETLLIARPGTAQPCCLRQTMAPRNPKTRECLVNKSTAFTLARVCQSRPVAINQIAA